MRTSLAAFRIERRTISVAIFVDHQLEHTESRHLSSVYAKALNSASRYVDHITTNFSAKNAAVDMQLSTVTTTRTRLTAELVAQLRQAGVSVHEVETAALLSAFRDPPLQSRRELRESVASIWPILTTDGCHSSCLDAAALGLYVQVQNLFGTK